MNEQEVNALLTRIRAAVDAVGEIRLMEVCGTHTVSLFRSGVKSMLPAGLRLISGPGCPVCVTSQGYLDAACEAAAREGVTVCTYGDMVRVPSRDGSLEQMRGQGADVRVVYSARDAVAFARNHPDRRVVFLAVGFETTTPPTAAAILEAHAAGLDNFLILPGHKRVMPALHALLGGTDLGLHGLLCPGHVSVILGSDAYRQIVEPYRLPCVIAGFEPRQLLLGIAHLCEQAARGEAKVENVYGVAVHPQGNPIALRWIEQIFQTAPAIWRAIGEIPDSGLALREPYARFDAVTELGLTIGPDYEPPGCLCGRIIQGLEEPLACPHFGASCTPMRPVGPCMVSSEGTCAAWYKYRRTDGLAD